MNRSLLQSIVLALCIGWMPTGSHAAHWSIASTEAAPGDRVEIDIEIVGDGRTIIGELEIAFDNARLRLPVESGVIPGGGGGDDGICVRTSVNRVLVRSSLSREEPLPDRPTRVCRLPFEIVKSAAPGTAPLTAVLAECFDEGSAVEPCTAGSGVVRVRGELATPPPRLPRTPQLAVLLSADPAAPTVEQLAAFRFGSGDRPPLAALEVESPTRAFALMPLRAKGDFAEQLRRYPDTARAKIERYAVVDYPRDADLRRAIEALGAEPHVIAVYLLPGVEFPGGAGSPVPAPGPADSGKSAALQYHFAALGIESLWQRAGGWSLIGFVDSGLAVEHPDLRSLTGANSQSGSYTGGNYLPAFALDFGNIPDFVDFDVDEAQPVPNNPPLPNEADCDPDEDGFMHPVDVGHGTHVASLAASNPNNGDGIDGVCRRCGIAMVKMYHHQCQPFGDETNPSVRVFSVATDAAAMAGILTLLEIGVPVLSLSFGLSAHPLFCSPAGGVNANEPLCLMLRFAAENDVLVAASSGNFRGEVFFPGSDRRVVAVGGLDEALQFWDEAPGCVGDECAQCPYSDEEEPSLRQSQCGSNFSQTPPNPAIPGDVLVGVPLQELVFPARNVLAAMYPGKNWEERIGCGDAFGVYPGATAGDGIGTCTGTSMSAPQAAGLFGVLRSINPLLPAGDPENPAVQGIRDVVVSTTDRALVGGFWDQRFGYGMPVPEAAAAKMLGTVGGQGVRNRTTPLFTIFSPGAQDYAALASPQAANALIRYQAASYAPTGAFIEGEAIAGYSHFPLLGSGGPSYPARVRAHILTTEFSREIHLPPIVPLFLLDRARSWPPSCDPNSPPCNTLNRDFALASSVPDLEAAVNGGYALKGLQGYVYARCTPEPACIPPAAERLYQQCNTAADDCAVFLERDRATFEAAGYLALPSFSPEAVLGYAYSNDDSDGDGLVDGMEYVIGTNPFAADSDGDGIADAVRYPLAGIPTGDPCSGPSPTCLVNASLIFADGFE